MAIIEGFHCTYTAKVSSLIVFSTLLLAALPEFDLRYVMEVVRDLTPANLPDLAMQLGQPHSSLLESETNYVKDVGRVKLETINRWMKNGSKPKASWAVLKAALMNVEKDLAEKIP